MNSEPGGQPSDGHFKTEEDLIDAEVELAKALEDLATVEEQTGHRRAADRHKQQATDVERRAAREAKHLATEYRQADDSDKGEAPPRRH